MPERIGYNTLAKTVVISGMIISTLMTAVNKWLQSFAYHITIHWWVFALAVLITLLIALLTVGSRALKAATANPADNLRVE